MPPSPSWCSFGWLSWLRCTSAVFLLVVAGQDLRHLGRFGPEGQLCPGWLCWLRCTSAMFLLVVAGQDLRHLGRFGPEGQLCPGWLCWLRCTSAVFLLVVAGQDLRHLGRFGPEGQLCPGWLCWLRCSSALFLLVVAGQDLRHLGPYDQKDSCSDMNKAGYAACDAPRAVSSLVRRPMMIGIMAVSDQKDYCTFYWQWHVQGLFCWPLHLAMCSLACLAGPDARHLGRYEPEGLIRVLHCCSHARCVQRQMPWLRGAVNCGFSAVAAHVQGRRLPCRTAKAHPHDQAVQQTIVIPLLPYTRWSMSLCTGRADFLRGAEAYFHVPDCLSDHSYSPVAV